MGCMRATAVLGRGLLIGAAALVGNLFMLPISGAETVPLHHVSSETCKSCHQEIYRQWSGSMHAHSTALSDPIHGTFYKMVVGEPTEEGVLHKASGKYPVCLSCHAPNAARDKTTKLDAMPAYSEGVNCVACHMLGDYKGIQGEDGKLRLGIKAYELSDTLQGPEGFPNKAEQLAAASDDLFGGALAGAESQKPNPHLGEPVEFQGKPVPALPLVANPQQMKSSDACMGCHDQRNNPHGVPLCQTGNEIIAGGSKANCQGCHMGLADGSSNHSMPGGHDPDMIRRGVIFDVDTESADGKVIAKVLVENLQPHSMPTGAPFRNMYLKLMAYDASGQVVWQNAEGHPGKTDPQAYFHYALQDDKGMPAPPPAATKPGDDTRLKPFEKRELTYEIPADGVVLVRGELYYNLLWPGLVQKFSHLPDDVKAPVLISASEEEITAP